MQKKYTDALLMAAEQNACHLDYWLEALSPEMARTGFPFEFGSGRQLASEDLHYETFEAIMTGEYARQVLEFCKFSDHTLHIFLVAASMLLLQKHTGHHDIIVGVPIYKQGEDGHYINPAVPVRVLLEDSSSFRKLLGLTRSAMVEAFKHQNYPVEMVADKLSLPSDLPGFSLFDVVVMMDAIHSRAFLDRIKPNIVITSFQTGDSIVIQWSYRPSLFSGKAVFKFASRFEKLVSRVTARMDITVEECSILTEEDLQDLLHNWNGTGTDYPSGRTVADLFGDLARSNPRKVVCVFEGDDKRQPERLTCEQLEHRARSIAGLLREKGVGPDTIVAVMTERSIQMMVAVAAVILAGGAFLPIDPGVPSARFQYLMNDSGSKLLLTQPEFIENTAGPWESIDIDTISPTGDYGGESTITEPRHLFYVIYTSGTTGKPKGVCLTHRNIVNYTSWFIKMAEMTGEDRTLYTASFAFDLVYTMIVPAFFIGSQIHFITRDTNLSPEKFLRYVDEQRISIIKATPSLYNVIINSEGFENAGLSSVRVVLFGGEPINARDARRFHDCFPHVRIMNHYGPTETTIGSCALYIDFEKFDRYMANPTIGRPIHNTHVLVLDNKRRLVPAGVWGELYIGGDGVARGYLNRQELTYERFIQNPISGDGYLYSTGDVARWRLDGKIELGERIDDQIKIRGYRVELGEIEKHVLNHHGVKEAFVTVKNTDAGSKSLVAYIVPSGENVVLAEIKAYLGQLVPEYMVPHHFVKLDHMPLTLHNKIDRARLPEPEGSGDENYCPPGSRIQIMLIEVMSDVLGVAKIGIYDNFFEIGGDSIKAVMVSARMRKYGWNLEVRDIFSLQIVEKMAEAARPVMRNISQAEVYGDVKLTPVQHRFFRNIHSNRNQFNQAVMLFKKDGFAEDVTRKVLEKLIEHHDALRMIFRFDAGAILQKNRRIEAANLEFEIISLDSDPDIETAISRRCEIIQAGMDIENGIVFRSAQFKTAHGHHLLLAVHHLVMDGISWRILLEDFSEGYRQVEQGVPVEFSGKTDSYQYWAQRLNEYADGTGGRDFYSVLSELDYWRKTIAAPIKPLPCDFAPTGTGRRFSECDTVTVKLAGEQTALLLGDAHRAYNTHINDILLTALWRAISQWTGEPLVLIDLEGHGREEIIEDIDINRTVGWFATHFPVALDGEAGDPGLAIKKIKDTMRRIPNNGIGYGILKYLTAEQKKAGYDFSLQPQILFNYMGEFGLEAGDLEIGMSNIKPSGAIGPEVERLYPLDVMAMVVGKELSVSFTFSAREYQRSTIQRLAGDYISSLNVLIGHCSGREQTEFTPTDYDYSGLSLEELAGLQDDVMDIE